jgi:hypothetical protein
MTISENSGSYVMRNSLFEGHLVLLGEREREREIKEVTMGWKCRACERNKKYKQNFVGEISSNSIIW